MEKYVTAYIKYAIMNNEKAYEGNAKKANYAANKIKKIEDEMLNKGLEKEFIDSIILTTNDMSALEWICAYAMKINYRLEDVKKILTNILNNNDSSKVFGAQILLESIKSKGENS